MAISILNQTTAALTQASYHISIPATSVGSTLVVSVTSAGGTSNYPFGVGDEQQSFPYYTQVVSGTRTDSSVRRTAQIWYRDNVGAGITDVFIVPNDSSGMNMYAIVWELAGVNHVTPFEGGNVRNITDTNTFTTSGTALTTSYTNAFFVGNGVRTSTAQLGTNTNSFTRDYHVEAGSTAHVHCHKTASGSQTLVVDHAFGSAGMLIGIADFNPSPNDYTLDLTEDLTTSDTVDPVADYILGLLESASLSDAIDLVLSSNERFKTLLDSVALAATVSFVAAYTRLFQEEVLLSENLTFVHTIFRTISDTVKLQDWLEIERHGDHWGN